YARSKEKRARIVSTDTPAAFAQCANARPKSISKITPPRSNSSASTLTARSDGRAPRVPVRRLLVGVPETEDRRLLERAPAQLEADRQAARREAARQRQRRLPREVERRHVALREREGGIGRHLVRRGRLRRRRRREHVDALHHLGHLGAELHANTLRLHVLR